MPSCSPWTRSGGIRGIRGWNHFVRVLDITNDENEHRKSKTSILQCLLCVFVIVFFIFTLFHNRNSRLFHRTPRLPPPALLLFSEILDGPHRVGSKWASLYYLVVASAPMSGFVSKSLCRHLAHLAHPAHPELKKRARPPPPSLRCLMEMFLGLIPSPTHTCCGRMSRERTDMNSD